MLTVDLPTVKSQGNLPTPVAPPTVKTPQGNCRTRWHRAVKTSQGRLRCPTDNQTQVTCRLQWHTDSQGPRKVNCRLRWHHRQSRPARVTCRLAGTTGQYKKHLECSRNHCKQGAIDPATSFAHAKEATDLLLTWATQRRCEQVIVD
ncbi:hypothetical protein CgunFtcFv8_018167 [Champsocephalus gunnari]|uniref:Uncharacterized protein n=1 Tax=Champsocephalus gunnari TaxID=52237 RepID=A0AAN8HWB8_CHAGU|nr:hypothetical protein CgunFtcFv8_018167 [Champsocephalus gunnari]